MSSVFLSNAWYRVAKLRPRLHAHVRIHRQRLRGEAWYVLADRSAARAHRFTPAAYAFISQMNGERTVDELWNQVVDALGDDAPSQDDVIQLLHQLHAADVLQSGVPPDVEEMGERRRKQERSLWVRNLMNPMAFRIPLWDPERFLGRSWPVVGRLFGPLAAIAWLVVVGWALVLAGMHWDELTENVGDRVLAFENLFLLWLTYPLVKFCHELGHAYAVKSGGGEVHEMGIMFLLFAPVPYVDASASSAFRGKGRRALVGAAGMIVEVFIAAIAMFVWVAAEPGLIRAIAFNLMLIGGFATVVFNGNPLLRFDGYYILSDLIEIPNLAQRAVRYWAYLAKRYLFGKDDAESPAHTRGERAWFLIYAPLSWVYRLTVMVAIALFLVTQYFFVGVVLGAWSVVTMLVMPIGKALSFVFTHAELDRHRRRAVGLTLGAIAVAALLAVLVPVPAWTTAEGVVWVPGNAEVRPGADGFVDRVLVASGHRVMPGDPVVELGDPDLLAEAEGHRARIVQLDVQLASELFDDRIKAELTRQEREAERAALERLERRMDELVVRAGRAGRWVVPNAADLPGKYYKQGTLLGYVLADDVPSVRIVVGQDDVDRVRGNTGPVSLKFADRPGETFRARVIREVPGGSESLPSKALAIEGGGGFATDPRDPNGLKTLGRTFQFDVAIDGVASGLAFGMRSWARFDHAHEPLATQVYRRIRQLFLSHLNV